jgi:HK97 family phage prohead protease
MTKTKGAPVERLFVGLGEVKITDGGSDDEMTFSGYGAVFGNIDSYGDVIAKGAFAETLRKAHSSGQWPAMLSQHGGMFGEDATPIGIYTEMREDDHGLYVEGKLAPTMKGREAYELLKMTPRPAYNGLSIGFRPVEFSLRSKPEEPRRTLKAVELLEVSLVTFPANAKARVTSVKNEFNPRELEDSLRDAGLSRADSVKAVAVFKEMLQREAGEPQDGPRDEDASAELRSLADRIRALSA